MSVRTYALSTQVTVGSGWLDDVLPERLVTLGRKGLLVLGQGQAFGTERRETLLQRLRQASLDPVVCEGIGPDGHLEELRAAADRIPAGVEWVLAIGGGSVIDAAKLLALQQGGRPLMQTVESVSQLASRLEHAESCRTIAVPTCFGSGAEVSNLAELIDASGWKEPVVCARLAPDEAWIDSEFTTPPPASIQAAAIVDLLFNLLDPLVSGGGQASAQDSMAKVLCQRLVSLVARVPSLYFAQESARELAWLSHLAVQPGLARPRTASILHRIEHVASPAIGCAHGEGLAWLAASFLRRISASDPATARWLMEVITDIFGEEAAPDRVVERWLAKLPLTKVELPPYFDPSVIADRTLLAYGKDGKLDGPLAFQKVDIEVILEDASGVHCEREGKSLGLVVETHPVNADRVFGGPIEGSWDWLLLTPLAFVQEDMEAWRPRWTSGWYPTLRLVGLERGLVVQCQPGSNTALDVLTLLQRAGADFNAIRFLGLCGALSADWPIGTWVQPSAAWGDYRLRDPGCLQPTPLTEAGDSDPKARFGICGSVSNLTIETTELLEAWRICAVDVVDLETFTVASFGRRAGIPVSADLVVSDHPLTEGPLWSNHVLPSVVRQRSVDIFSRRVAAATVPLGVSRHA